MSAIDDLMANLGGGLTGFLNGARSFGDQAKWQMGGYGNAPMPAPYAGGPDYPTKDDANAYVRNNWPSDGIGMFSTKRPDTFATPYGYLIPTGGRDQTIGEMIDQPNATKFQIRDAVARALRAHMGIQ
jgi:hypothetical protein